MPLSERQRNRGILNYSKGIEQARLLMGRRHADRGKVCVGTPSSLGGTKTHAAYTPVSRGFPELIQRPLSHSKPSSSIAWIRLHSSCFRWCHLVSCQAVLGGEPISIFLCGNESRSHWLRALHNCCDRGESRNLGSISERQFGESFEQVIRSDPG